VVPTILLQRNPPTLKIHEAHTFPIQIGMQLITAKPRGFREHPCLLLHSPLTALNVIGTHNRQATRLLKPARRALLANTGLQR